MAEEVKNQNDTGDVNETNTNTEKTTDTTNVKENKQNEEQLKAAGKNAFLESLGYDEETLSSILKAHKEAEDANKTDLQKSQDLLDATTKELTKERGLRLLAEAKTEALIAGARPELIEDLVVIAKSRVTKDKDISTVISEIKSSATGSVYFKSEDEGEESGGKTNKRKQSSTVTRGRVTNKDTKKEDKDDGLDDKKKEVKHEGSIASRLLGGKKPQAKSSYFDN